VALALAATGRFPVKTVADTLGVARSNLVEQLASHPAFPATSQPDRPRRDPYRRTEDETILAEIRAITDARPTYGYRRVTALLNRARRSSDKPPLNHKRVFRLMRLSSLLLQPHTGRRAIRAHEGTVVAPASNQRWASDGFEIPCWNGEVVRFGRSLGPVALRPCPLPSTLTTARSWPGPAPPPAASAAR
jgi:putative transposase